MRDIKFRAYEKIIKHMFSYEELQSASDGLIYIGNEKLKEQNVQHELAPGGLFIPTKDKKMEIMQYTGLKDTNGKEIYEGDIVTGKEYPFISEEKQNYVGIVVFYEDVAQFEYEYKCVRKDKKGISNGINNEFGANENLICENLEVIGNIYENPELLEEK